MLPMSFFDEAVCYVVPNVLSPRVLVFRPDLSDKNWMPSKSLTKVCVKGEDFLLHHGFTYKRCPPLSNVIFRKLHDLDV